MGPHCDSRLVSLFSVVLFLLPHCTAATWASGSEERRVRPSPSSKTPAYYPIPDAKRTRAFFLGTDAEYSLSLNRRPVTTTETRRALLQDVGDAENGDEASSEFECALRGSPLLARIRVGQRGWRVDDSIMFRLRNDLQMIINCTRPGDTIALNTTHTTRLATRLIIPWSLTFNTDIGAVDFDEDIILQQSRRKAHLSCPGENEGLFLIRARNVTFANLVFEGCSFGLDSREAIVEVAPCRSGGMEGTVRWISIIVRDNQLAAETGLKVQAPSCSAVEMISVRYQNNTCSGQACGALLSQENRMENCTVSRNRLEDPRDRNTHLFHAPPGSHTNIEGLVVSRNVLTVFHLSDASLSLSRSSFQKNSVSFQEDGDQPSPCLYLTRSSVTVSSSIFRKNRGPSGAALYIEASNVSLSDTSFEENTATRGGVLFLEMNSAAFLHHCVLLSNHASRDGGAFFASESNVYATRLDFLNNSAVDKGGSVYTEGSNMTIRHCQFENGSANRGGFLATTESISNISRSVFVRGSGEFGGCIALENDGRSQVRHASVQFCKARQDGGAIHLQSHSSIGFENVTFVSNTAASEGNVIYSKASTTVIKDILAANNTGAENGGVVSCFNNSRLEISDSVLEGNAARFGGALYIRSQSRGYISHSLLWRNQASESGGSIYMEEGSLSLNRTRFAGGTALHGGHLSVMLSEIVISNSSFTNGSAVLGGCMVISRSSVVSIRHSSLTGCNSQDSGASIYMQNSTLRIQISNISDSTTQLGYGGIACAGESQLEATDSIFSRNKAYSGGSLMIHHSALARIARCEFLSNEAEGPGGAIYIEQANASFHLCNFSRNRALAGGSIYATRDGHVRLTDSFFADGFSQYGGSLNGIGNVSFWLRNVTITGCRAEEGGAIALDAASAATVINSTFLRNRANSRGGAILAATATLVGSRMFLSGNRATSGGGVHCDQRSRVEIRHSDFQDNSAENGGAMHISHSVTGTFANISFYQNAASYSGGVAHVAGSTVHFTNCRMNGNRASSGGGFSTFVANLNISHSSFVNGTASENGGFLAALGPPMVALYNVTLTNAHAKDGGAIYVFTSTITAEHVNFSECTASSFGGAIHSPGQSALVCNDCFFVNNSAGLRGGAVSMYSFGLRPIALQLDQNVFRHNTARWGGVVICQPLTTSICSICLHLGGLILLNDPIQTNCSNNSTNNCSLAVITGTIFQHNEATVAGGGLMTSDIRTIRLSCASVEREDRNQLYTGEDLMALDFLQSLDDVCETWSGNIAGRYAPNAGTFAVQVKKTIVLANGTEIEIASGDAYYVMDHASGSPLPIVQLEAVDGLGQGPAVGLQSEVIEASMSASKGFFSGSVNVAMVAGIGNFSRVVGFGIEGVYECTIVFSEQSIAHFSMFVHIRGCTIGEVAAANGTICEPCTSDTYNLGSEDEPGCHPCPDNGNCASHIILPDKGYWHPTPCSKHLQKCLSSEMCDFNERASRLEEATRDLESCHFAEEDAEAYTHAQCKEGYDGPLCGSCQAHYGRLHSFLCEKCSTKFASVLVVFLSFLVLMVLTGITVRGSLVSTLTVISNAQQATSPSSQPPAQPHMMESYLTGEVPNDVAHPSTVSRSDPDQTAKDIELAQWKAIELFKITLNFFQVTAVAISINVEWTKPVIVLFKTAEFAGGVTSEAIHHSVDCLVPTNAAMERSIASVLIDFSVPLAAVLVFASYWMTDKAKNKTETTELVKKIVLSFLAVFYISYVSLTKTLVKIVTCIKVHSSAIIGVDSTADYWATDTSIHCYQQSHAVLAFVLGWPFLFLFTLGFPLVIAYLVMKNVQEDYKQGWIYEVSGFMYRSYQKRFVFWESVILLKKAILTVVVVLSYPLGTNLQHILAVFVLSAALYFQMLCRPYREEFDDLNALENLSVLVSLLTFVSSMFFGDDVVSDAIRIVVTLGIIVGNLALFFVFLHFIVVFSTKYLKAVLDSENVPYDADRGTWHIVKVYVVNYVIQFIIKAILDYVRNTNASDASVHSVPTNP